ncbi:tetratricopeptide repeat-containing sulfotransferase family protein [Croceicoccus bisphenolivorans]|uniref:tetratricopeptide repeat-containing sulfotransferase family protein n=1 Tax=Croceicoccus bisphenolivorans TaxID=1783232 RepID=UPI000ACD0584|nr:tetratricopeptide repeat-containing sulfotransferase family protein [Croceicoccus bisphenolivorans]
MNAKSNTLVTDEMIQQVQKGSLQMKEGEAIAMAGELYSRGKYDQAAKVCRQIIGARPTVADAHNILGVSLNALGKSGEGIASIRQAIKLSPKVSSFHSNLGEIQRLAGELDAARQSLESAASLDPQNAQAANNLGIVHYEQKDYEQAVECYRRAIEIRPDFPEAHNNLGNSLRMTGDTDGAMDAYQTALTQREIYPEVYNNLGTLLREQRKIDQARHALKKAIQQNPRYVEAYNNLAALYHSERDDTEALRQLADVLRIAPDNAKSLVLTARIQLRRGNYPAAEQACRLVLKQDPKNAEALTVLGELMHELDRYDAAIQLLEKALEFEPSNAEARNFYGVALKSVGRLDEAREQILKGLDENANLYGAYANLNDLVDFSQEPELFARIEAIVEESSDPEAERMLPIHYAYAKALDDRGEHEKALEHYLIGGRLKRGQLNYVEENNIRFFNDIKAQFPAEIFRNRPFAGLESERPVFILGMPRSGSTLIEQIISAHPDVHGAGEVKYLSRSLQSLRDRFPTLPVYPEIVSSMNGQQCGILAEQYLKAITAGAGDAKRITDKLLTNYFFVGLIHLMFPNAKIINTLRNPVDTCLSAFTKLFKDDMPHSYDLGELGRYYKQYEALMQHWREVLPEGVMMTVQYEDTVGATEKTARDVIEFIGLDWNEACLDFHTSARPVKTASVAQVRKPIYNSAVERWRKYGDGLKPLCEALGV